MRYYELMWILGADADDEASEQSMQLVCERVEGHDGELLRSDIWGRRTLAYNINHQSEGIYSLVQFQMEPSDAVAFEKDILADQAIVRHLQIRIEEQDLIPQRTPVETEA